MAKALFSKGERVFVRPVGVWSTVERIMPQWVKGVEEPLKVFYDVGLGRDFLAHELGGEARDERDTSASHTLSEHWRVTRMGNRWAPEAEALRGKHPFPGSYPVVVTDEQDWGGWRVPAAEYDRNPNRIEFQARVLVNALKMLRLTRDLAQFGGQYNVAMPDELRDLLAVADEVLADVYQSDPTDPGALALAD